MKKIILNSLVVFLIVSIFSCGKKALKTPPFSISKEFKTDSLTTLNVHISTRFKLKQLLSIASIIKADSAQITNLEIHYLLPGNTDISAGDHSYYASARLLKPNEIKPTDTLKDEAENVYRIKVIGMTAEKAKKLFGLKNDALNGKIIVGKFIDDYNHTVIIPFKDSLDKKGNLYVIELDSTAKIVSATVTLKVATNGEEKYLVTQNGDYITLKNKVLAQFAADGLGVPFNSIKAGN
jgi:hypothetical protein